MRKALEKLSVNVEQDGGEDDTSYEPKKKTLKDITTEVGEKIDNWAVNASRDTQTGGQGNSNVTSREKNTGGRGGRGRL